MNVRERLRKKPLAWASRYGTFIYVGTLQVVHYYGPLNRGMLVRRRSVNREVQSVRTQAVPTPFIRLLTESLPCPYPLPFNDLGRRRRSDAGRSPKELLGETVIPACLHQQASHRLVSAHS